MKVIHKYTGLRPHKPEECLTLVLPKGAQLVDLQYQHGEMMLWALVDPDMTEEERVTFYILGTGWKIDDSIASCLTHFKTLQGTDGLVWHVFRVVDPIQKIFEHMKL